MSLQLGLLLLYSLILILTGLYIGRTVDSSSRFFVAGRSLGPVLLFCTLLAANIGSGSTVGATGLGYRDGFSAWWWVGSAGIGSLVLSLWVGPKIWRIAQKHDLRTVGDFLELRYGSTVRGVVAAILWLATIAILAAQLIALAWVLNVVAGIPKPLGCLIGGIVITIYFTSGGLLASAWVNLLQLLVLVIGFALAVPFLLTEAGGWSSILQATSKIGPDYHNWFQGGGSGWVYLGLLVPAFIVSPGLLQKIFGARSAATVRRAVFLQGLALLLFALVPVFLGITARVLFPDLVNHELALPTLLVNALPVWIGSLALAAVFSAEISSADAILFMLATSLSRDLYHRFVDPEANDRRLLKVARLAAIVGGCLGTLLAMLSPSVIDALTIFYALLGVSLFVPIVAGLYSKRGGQSEALLSVVSGVVVALTADLATGGQGFGWITPNMMGLVVAAAAFGATLLTRHSSRKQET